jgi:predicted DNA binding CopG/RHH family protein
MKTPIYDSEELELLDFIENEKPDSVPNMALEIQELKKSALQKLNKRKPVNLRLLETDLERLKTEAIRVGMPYQTLISSILHRYITGNLRGSG